MSASASRSADTLCIIEAMKILNQVEADCAGLVTEVLVGKTANPSNTANRSSSVDLEA